MAKKAKKTSRVGKSTPSKTTGKKTVKKTASRSTNKKKKPASKKKASTRNKPGGESSKKKPATRKPPAAKKKAVSKKSAATKKATRRRSKKVKKLGRSLIPRDALLEVVFQKDLAAREAFEYLEMRTIRELEQMDPDQMIQRLTSPAKQTVGRIRKALALYNRYMAGDERFAIDFQSELQR